jgi:hypothetical protein
LYKFFAVFSLLVVCPLLFAQPAMDNDVILKMVKAGLSDDVVISTINSSPGQYAISPDTLIALKQAGVSDKVIAAMVGKNSDASAAVAQAMQPPPPPPVQAPTEKSAVRAEADNKPRVFLQAVSKGTNRNAERDQAMEMSKDFERDCDGLRVTINQQMADYTILLNHIEVGLFVRDNQIQVANKNGDLISKTKEGGSIAGGMRKACGLILEDWNKK